MVPVACVIRGANLNNTVLFECLLQNAFAVVAKIGTVFADKGADWPAAREKEPERYRGQPRDVPGLRHRVPVPQARPASRLMPRQGPLPVERSNA